jgi:hypothetical protein
LVNSRDARSIGEAMHDMESEELRTKLILEGQKQVQIYSWEHSARAMWLSIQKSLSADG